MVYLPRLNHANKNVHANVGKAAPHCGAHWAMQWNSTIPIIQMPAALVLTLRSVAACGKPPKLSRPKITPYKGTNTELSISKKGSMLCIGSTMARPQHTAAMRKPHWRTDHLGNTVWAETEPLYTSP